MPLWKTSRLRALQLLGLLAAFPGCGGTPLTAPADTVLQITASPLVIPAVGGVSNVTVIALDSGGPVPDGTQIFLTTPLGTIEERVETEGGIARATLRSDGRSGDAVVVASSGAAASVTLNPPVTIGVSEATRIVLSAHPAVASAPDFTSDIVATVFDAGGGPLGNAPLVFSTTAGRLASAGSVLRTDSQGRATDRLSLGGAQLARVTASSGSVVSAPVTVSRAGATGPVVSAVSPSSGNPGQTLEIVISGIGFESGAEPNFGGGTSATVLSTTPTSIRVRLEISSSATPGTRDVTVRNPVSGDSDTLPRGFTVGGGGPTVTAVEPSAGNPGQTLQVTIEGANFRTGARVTFGDGITVNVNSVSAGAIAARLTIGASARLGARDVTVTNPDGRSATLSDGFNVENAPPDVTSIQPVRARRALGGVTGVTISGSRFQTNARVTFEGTGITVTVVSVAPTSIVVNLVFDSAAATNARDVTVTNPDGRSDTLADGFTLDQ